VPRNSSILGLIGLVLLLFAGVAWVFTSLLTGGATTVDLVYISINAGLGAFALVTYLVTSLDHLRTMVSERSTKYGASTVLGSVFFIAILILVNIYSANNSARYDLTEQGVYSLSPQSIEVLKNLKQDLEVVAFVEGGINPALQGSLETFAQHSPHFVWKLVDPDKEPQLAEQYQVRTYNTVQINYGNESTKITQPTEENLTNAIIKVTRETKKTICLIEGHGEPDIDDQEAQGLASLKRALTDENYESKKILLATLPDVPEDCSVTALIGPRRPLQDTEIQALDRYLRTKSGRLLVALRPRSGSELIPFLNQWGVSAGDNLVVDQVVRLFQGPALGLAPLAREYGIHDITRDLKQITVFPMVRGVSVATDGNPGLNGVDLVKTSPSSWAETDLAGLFERNEASLDETTDQKGPVSIAAVIEAEAAQMGGQGSARLAVFGSADFAANREIDGTYYNRDLLMNTFGWLAGQSDLLSIRARTVRASRVSFTQEQATAIFYITVLGLPQLILLAGLIVWWRRE
jgi:ABC-type uncharacterized transport system involved in gliding motility auxiliary subunit